MFGQGNYGTQFRHGQPVAPPPPITLSSSSVPPPHPFQQGPSPVPPPPPFQHVPSQVLPPPPLPPVQQGQSRPVLNRPPTGSVPHQYLHGPPAPLQKSMPPSGALNVGQHYMHPPNYGTAPTIHSQALQARAYTPSMMPHNFHNVTAPVQLPSRPPALPPPPPPSQRCALYGNPPPTPQAIQYVPAQSPPPPPSFIHASFGSFVHQPPSDGHLSVQLPPAPPPPPPFPSSPPPLPSSPPPPMPTINDLLDDSITEAVHHGVNRTSEDQPVDPALGIISLTGGVLIDDVSQVEDGIADNTCPAMGGEEYAHLPSPSIKPAEDVIKNIKALCESIAKVGPHFESLKRTNEADNSQFSFLFGGEPGSTAAIGYEYFQWMKKKYNLITESFESSGQSFPHSSPLSTGKTKTSPQPDVVDDAAASSLADSDMDMGDDEHSFPGDRRAQDSPITTKNTMEDGALESSRPITMEGRPTNVSLSIYGNKNDGGSKVSLKDGNPFKQIQDYVSDDSSDDDKGNFISDVSPVRVSPQAETLVPASQKEMLEAYSIRGSSDAPETNTLHLGLRRDHVPTETAETSSSRAVSVVGTGFPKSQALGIKSAGRYNISSKQVEGSYRMLPPVDQNSRNDDLDYHGQAGRLGDKKQNLEAAHQYDNIQNSDDDAQRVGTFWPEVGAKQDSTAIKVDEFGRMVREGMSDSDDSDGVSFSRRHARRGRSSSRSLSPREGKWRRRSRSPWRRKDKRSRSHSWSPPKRQRVTSKSPPVYRHIGRFSRKDHGEPQCLDFMRGRCHRGASCRFLHHESGRHRSRSQKYQAIYDSDRYDADGEESHGFKNTVKEDGRVRQEFQSGQDKCMGNIHDPNLEVSSQVIPESAADDVKFAMPNVVGHPHRPEEVGRDDGSEKLLTEIHQEKVLSTQEAQSHLLQQKESTHQHSEDHNPVSDDILQNQAPSVYIEHSHSETSDHLQSGKAPFSLPSPATLATPAPYPEFSIAPQHPHPLDSSIPHASQAVPTETFPSTSAAIKPYSDLPSQGHMCPAPMSQPYLNNVLPPQSFSQSTYSSEFQPSSFPTSGHQFYSSSYCHPSTSRSSSTVQFLPSHQHPVNTSKKSAWTNVPQHGYFDGPARPSFPNTDFNRALYNQSLVPQVGNQQLHTSGGLSSAKVGQPSYSPVAADVQFPYEPPREQCIIDSHLTREQTQASFQQQHSVPLSSVNHGDPKYSQSFFPGEPFLKQMQGYPDGRLDSNASFSGEDFSMPGRIVSYPQPLLDNLQQPRGGNLPSNIGAPSNTRLPYPGNPSNFSEKNLQSTLRVNGVPIVSTATHYNPFASTFENTRTFGQENSLDYTSKRGSSFAGQHSADEHGPRIVASDSRTESSFIVGPVGRYPFPPSGEFSQNFHPMDYSAEVTVSGQKQQGRNISAADQYDPLFDSIEASSSVMKRLKSTLDKESAGISLENDEFGETATDAEVGAVEDGSPLEDDDGKEWSLGIPFDLVNPAAGEVDVEQVPSPGKSKKSKDSRSTKLFKIAVASFVKEVLKPSWRQGNMSKEAFKTIVKKTVDKVSSTMPSSRVPKSQAKINQYVESSQRKLTKLVMGYVDKYVKM